MAATFAALSADPEALQGDDLLRAADARRGHRRRCARSARSWSTSPTSRRRLRPGVNALADGPADPERRARGRRAACSSARRRSTSSWAVSSGGSRRWSSQPQTKTTLLRLRETFDQAAPAATYIVPYQTVCNYWNYWFTYLPEHLTERDNIGTTQRVSVIGVPRGPTGPTPAARSRRRWPATAACRPTAGGRAAAEASRPSRASSSRTSCRSCTATPTRPPVDDERQRRLPGRPDRLPAGPVPRCRASRSTTRRSASPTSPAAAARLPRPRTDSGPTAAEAACRDRARATSSRRLPNAASA